MKVWHKLVFCLWKGPSSLVWPQVICHFLFFQQVCFGAVKCEKHWLTPCKLGPFSLIFLFLLLYSTWNCSFEQHWWLSCVSNPKTYFLSLVLRSSWHYWKPFPSILYVLIYVCTDGSPLRLPGLFQLLGTYDSNSPPYSHSFFVSLASISQCHVISQFNWEMYWTTTVCPVLCWALRI